ncbi:MAG: metallophosphoesterase [Chloroflexi bacterium]|nr:metallophosphoesterase [Chloroflexota bacterium]
MTFSFIQITDHHLSESESILSAGYSTWYAFRAVMRHIAQHHADVDFIVSTGDLVDSGTDAEYQHFREKLGICETSAPPGPQRVSIEGLHDMPMYFLPGNQDWRSRFWSNMFPEIRDRVVMNIQFEHKEIQFICLDLGQSNHAYISHGNLNFLRRSLRNLTPSIILMHHAITPIGITILDSFLPRTLDAFADAIRERQLLAMFHGHFHDTYESQLEGVPIYGLRSTTFSFAQQGNQLLYVLRPPHYRVVRVDNAKITTKIIEVPL